MTRNTRIYLYKSPQKNEDVVMLSQLCVATLCCFILETRTTPSFSPDLPRSFYHHQFYHPSLHIRIHTKCQRGGGFRVGWCAYHDAVNVTLKTMHVCVCVYTNTMTLRVSRPALRNRVPPSSPSRQNIITNTPMQL